MKVNLQSTSKIITLIVNGAHVPARIWEGVTDKGVPCHAFITLIAVDKEQDCAEFDRDLHKHAAPTPTIEAIPLRLIL